jgi:hypothetical protein
MLLVGFSNDDGNNSIPDVELINASVDELPVVEEDKHSDTSRTSFINL